MLSVTRRIEGYFHNFIIDFPFLQELTESLPGKVIKAVRIQRVPVPGLPVAMRHLNSWTCQLSVIALNPKPTDFDHTISFCFSELINIMKNP